MNSKTAAEITSNQHKKIMIVDDDECIRLTIQALFAMDGIEVLCADGSAECLRYLRDGFRGVILMDIMMPEKDGWDTIREIITAGLHQGNIIAMLSAMDAPDERMEGLQEFVIDYITKPFDPEYLIDTVHKYFGYLKNAQSVAN